MRQIALALFFAAACGGGGGNNPPGDDTTNPDGNNPNPDTPGDTITPMGKATVFTIVLENHDFAEIVGSSNAPFLNSLIAMGALATNYNDTIHPSLGNYLHLISGEDQYPGFVDVGPKQAPFFPADKQHLGSQLQAAGVKWRAYQESMGSACNLNDNGKYAPKHNPFIYFKDIQENTALCADVDVDYSQFAADLATNDYRYMWITPNLDSDGHDPSGDPVTALKHSDTWMSQEVPKILDSDGFKNGGVLFITWDEAEDRSSSGPDKIPMIVLSPRVKQAGMTSSTKMDHGSYLATVETLFGFQRLAPVASVPTLMEFLNP
jgi:phosphatidylinositol-3-phosphatase